MKGHYREIGNYIKDHHVGQGNAVLSSWLQRKFGYSRRHIITIISELCKHGYAILGSNDGYYYAKDALDYRLCIDDLRHKQLILEKSINDIYTEMERTL